MNFTKHAIESLPTPPKKRALHYDDKVSGLGVLVQPSTGHRAFFWYKFVRDRPKWTTLGVFPDLSVEQARARASELNALAAKWKLNGYAGENPFAAPGKFTLKALLDDYAARHLAKHAKNPDKAVSNVRWMFERYIPSHWHTRTLAAVRRADVRGLHDTIGAKHGHVTANRVLEVLCSIFNFAAKEERFSGENPAANITPFTEQSRTRFLKPDEAPKFFKALADEPNADLRDFIWLALSTAARRGNIVAMRWDELDLNRGLWLIADTKNREPLALPLMDEALKVLTERRKRLPDATFVFPSDSASGHVIDFKGPWAKFLKRAGIENFHIHDLRRTAATYSVGAGASLPIAGRMLGHKTAQATSIYARVDLAPVRDAIRAGMNAMLAAGKLLGSGQ